VRVLSIASSEMIRERNEALLAELLPEIRIDAKPQVLIRPKDKSIGQLIRETSADSEVVFLGLAVPDKDSEGEYADRIMQLSEGLTTVFFVRNSSPFGGELLATGSEESPTATKGPKPVAPAPASTTEAATPPAEGS
jgi:hypothetical protein